MGYELLDMNQNELREMESIAWQEALAEALQARWERTNAWIVLKVEMTVVEEEGGPVGNRRTRAVLNDVWKMRIRGYRPGLGSARSPTYTRSFLVGEEMRRHPDLDGGERRTFRDFLARFPQPATAYGRWVEAAAAATFPTG